MQHGAVWRRTRRRTALLKNQKFFLIQAFKNRKAFRHRPRSRRPLQQFLSFYPILTPLKHHQNTTKTPPNADKMETKWRQNGDKMETKRRQNGDKTETKWRQNGDKIENTFKLRKKLNIFFCG